MSTNKPPAVKDDTEVDDTEADDPKKDDEPKKDDMALDVGCAEGSIGNTLIYVLMAMTIIFVLLFIIFMVLYLFSRSTVADLRSKASSAAAVGNFVKQQQP
jgi:hypothetical protein